MFIGIIVVSHYAVEIDGTIHIVKETIIVQEVR